MRKKEAAFLKKSGAKNFCHLGALAQESLNASCRRKPVSTPFLLLLLASCGTLPEPFYGNPGPVAAHLAIPPAPVLMVPTPNAALLGQAAPLYAQDLATALVNYDIPSIAGPIDPNNWRLIATANLSGNTVTPAYAIIGPDNKTYGTLHGTQVNAEAWAAGDPAALTTEAQTDAAALAKTLAAINAKIQGNNPNALENRPPRIFVATVTGAPGDGNTSLPLNLTRDLPGPDDEVVTDKSRADFTVTGQVKSQPDNNGQLLVELDWTVTDTNNRKIGQVTQIHDLAPTDITPYWGDVAAAAAQEAASGIQQVVQNAVLKKGN